MQYGPAGPRGPSAALARPAEFAATLAGGRRSSQPVAITPAAVSPRWQRRGRRVAARRRPVVPDSVAIRPSVVAVVAGVMIGPAGPAWWRVPLELLDRLPLVAIDSGVTDVEWNIVWQVRMPRVLLGGIVGAMLSLAGASYQGVFRNPLVEPYLLGAAAGAGLGATLVFTVLARGDAGLAGRSGAGGGVRRRPRHGVRHVRRRAARSAAAAPA